MAQLIRWKVIFIVSIIGLGSIFGLILILNENILLTHLPLPSHPYHQVLHLKNPIKLILNPLEFFPIRQLKLIPYERHRSSGLAAADRARLSDGKPQRPGNTPDTE